MVVSDLQVMFGILGFLWFADEILTVLDVQRFGLSREENPIVSKVLKRGAIYFTVFKLVTFAIFVTGILLVETINPLFATIITAVSMVLYLLAVIRNLEIYEVKK